MEESRNLGDILGSYWQGFLEVLPRLAMAVLVIVIGILIAGFISRFLRRRLEGRMDDPLMGRFIANLLKTALIIVVLMLGLQAAGLSGVAGGLLAAAGATTVVLGFAFKDIGENFLAGIILAFNRPFQINDAIKVGDIFGKVKALDFRYTHIKSFDGRDVFVPNGTLLQEPVENYTRDGYFRMDFIVGIDYDDDVEGASARILSTIRQDGEVVAEAPHEPFVVTEELAASTVNLKVYFWVNTDDYRKGSLETKGRVMRQVKKRLLEEGYGLPADIREIKFYGGAPFPIQGQKEEKGKSQDH
ncbi:mechanosensitive ion channel family protein [Cesiribacter andamanensis]|uniref:Small-conductance mechanosensitive channel n=1 Tax=Cesiribacter andamanensis AMV16 TaxID=1279009 RepID=M7P2E8_9BACT|nr:mechanosensitive ion channel family protein [Cesiribacter andamanensis]EMR04729.1 Small-conductance mechanosensitive channel [Cesiribacter andamanensis AMV16]